MGHQFSLKSALVGGIAGLFLAVAPLHAQTVVNPNFELPDDGASGTDGTATGWTLNPAVGDNYTNPGARCQFDTPTPSGGTWSLWLQTFVQFGSATQLVPAVQAGTDYNFSAQMAFEVPGYNNVTLANQASDSKSQDTGSLESYLGIQYENGSGQNVGLPTYTLIPAGSITAAAGTNSDKSATNWAPYSVSALAPAGATQALVEIGWINGGLDGNTGGQSAFATSTSFTAVPEPASLSMIGMGGMALLARRRTARKA